MCRPGSVFGAIMVTELRAVVLGDEVDEVVFASVVLSDGHHVLDQVRSDVRVVEHVVRHEVEASIVDYSEHDLVKLRAFMTVRDPQLLK